MEQLLEIKTVPIALEFRIQQAKLEMTSEPPAADITRLNGTFQVSHQYPRINIDTTELRNSMNHKSPMRAAKDSAEEGMQAAMEATARIAEEGNALMNIQDGMNVPSLIRSGEMQRFESSLDCMMVSIPSVPADINWEPTQFSMQFEADKLAFDWRTHNKIEAQYVPAKVEFYVKQYPHVEITYVGKPNYVPPSASPDYEPPKMDVSA